MKPAPPQLLKAEDPEVVAWARLLLAWLRTDEIEEESFEEEFLFGALVANRTFGFEGIETGYAPVYQKEILAAPDVTPMTIADLELIFETWSGRCD